MKLKGKRNIVFLGCQQLIANMDDDGNVTYDVTKEELEKALVREHNRADNLLFKNCCLECDIELTKLKKNESST